MNLALRRSFYCIYLIAISALAAAFIYLSYASLNVLVASWGNWAEMN